MTSGSPASHRMSPLAFTGHTVVDATDTASSLPFPRIRRARTRSRRVLGDTRRVVSVLDLWGRPSLWSVIAVVAVVWTVVAVGSHALDAEHHATHSEHPLATSLGAEFVVDGHHAHLGDGVGASHHPEHLSTAVLPQPAGTALVALGMVTAMVAVSYLVLVLMVSPGRGPPAGMAPVVAGRGLLTRFCLSRR